MEDVRQLRHPSFTQSHIELLLPNIISLLNSLNRRVRNLEVAAARREQALDEHMEKTEAFHELLILRLPRVPSTNVVGEQALDKAHSGDIEISTVDMITTPGDLNVSTAPQANHGDELVVPTTPAAEIADIDPDGSGVPSSAAEIADVDPDGSGVPSSAAEIAGVDSDGSGVPSSAETVIGPMNREQAQPEFIQDIRLSTDVEQAVAEPIHDTNVSTGPNISPSDTASQNVDGLDDHDHSNHNVADTDRRGMYVPRSDHT